MADNSKIEWTDATWNPVTGCSVVSPGCTNCYAMRLAGGRMRSHPSRVGLTDRSKAGPVWNGRLIFNREWLDLPLRWRRPRMVFVCAHGDLFHENVPDEWIDRIFAVMALAPQHRFQVLTKRAARMREYMSSIDNGKCGRLDGYRDALIEGTAQEILYERFGEDSSMWLAVSLPLPNVWLGVSVEDQARAEERIPDLLATPAAVRWVSAEPLLGPVDLEVAWAGETALNAECWGECGWCENGLPPLHNCQRGLGDERRVRSGLDWIVAGGESGPGARPMHPDWARGLRDQCAAAGVPFFFKQWGEWAPETAAMNCPVCGKVEPGATGGLPGYMARVGKKAAGRELDGRTHDAMPERREP
jgi:protein gp37